MRDSRRLPSLEEAARLWWSFCACEIEGSWATRDRPFSPEVDELK